MEHKDRDRLLQLILLIAGAMFIGEHLVAHLWKSLVCCVAGLYAVDTLRWFEDWQARSRAKDEADKAREAARHIDWTTFPPSWRTKDKADHK